MSWAIAAACGWIAAASLIGALPSRDHHWRAAFGLIAIGIPILGWLTYVDGPVWGLAALAAGVSILRWPVVHLWRWVRRGVQGPAE